MERRNKPRMSNPFRATVRGTDAFGKRFEADTVVDNLSTGGLYLRLAEIVKPRTKMQVIIWLSEAGRILVNGEVLRVELQTDRRVGVAMAFKSHRFL